VSLTTRPASASARWHRPGPSSHRRTPRAAPRAARARRRRAFEAGASAFEALVPSTGAVCAHRGLSLESTGAVCAHRGLSLEPLMRRRCGTGWRRRRPSSMASRSTSRETTGARAPSPARPRPARSRGARRAGPRGASRAGDAPRCALFGRRYLYVAEQSSQVVRRVAVATGATTTVAGTPNMPGIADGPLVNPPPLPPVLSGHVSSLPY